MKNKPFDQWNINKKQVDCSARQVLFHEGEIWWTQVGLNVGIEQNGKGNNFLRPVLIFKKYNRQHFLGIPLTTQKMPAKFSFHLTPSTALVKKESWIVFSQIRIMDSKRLHNNMGKLPKRIFEDIQKKVVKHLSPTNFFNMSPASKEAGSVA